MFMACCRYVSAVNAFASYNSLKMDMTAWVKSGTREEVGIITDYVDPRLAIRLL
jgi:hypothetical protein